MRPPPPKYARPKEGSAASAMEMRTEVSDDASDDSHGSVCKSEFWRISGKCKYRWVGKPDLFLRQRAAKRKIGLADRVQIRYVHIIQRRPTRKTHGTTLQQTLVGQRLYPISRNNILGCHPFTIGRPYRIPTLIVQTSALR